MKEKSENQDSGREILRKKLQEKIFQKVLDFEERFLYNKNIAKVSIPSSRFRDLRI